MQSLKQNTLFFIIILALLTIHLVIKQTLLSRAIHTLHEWTNGPVDKLNTDARDTNTMLSSNLK